MHLTVETEREEDGRWITEVPELAGVLAYGQTRDEAMARSRGRGSLSMRANVRCSGVRQTSESRSSEVVMTRIACAAAFLLALGCRSAIDTTREAQALLDTDRAWARVASTTRNTDSVISFWSDEARVAMPDAPLFRGKNELRAMVASTFAVPGLHVMWTPENAVVAASGDFGYTTGTNEMSVPDSSGKVMKSMGRYLKVWRRESGGRWRSVEEYTSPAPHDAPPRR